MIEHPIQGMMITAMESIKDMVDVNTIIGEPIETTNNVVIIPISRVAFGFAAGGSEFKGETIDEYTKKDKEEEILYRLPFGGGSGAGVSINPIAFLVVQDNMVKLLPVSYSSTIEKLLDYIPDLLEKTNTVLNKTIDEIINDKKEKKPKAENKEDKENKVNSPNMQENNNMHIKNPLKPNKKGKVITKETPEEEEYEYTEDNTLEDE